MKLLALLTGRDTIAEIIRIVLYQSGMRINRSGSRKKTPAPNPFQKPKKVLHLIPSNVPASIGALAENYVLQSLTAQFQASFRYWTSGNKAEVDFLLQHGNHIYPVEVKADQNITGKSLIQYEKLYQPACRIRYSMLNLKQDGNLINIPLFLADKTKELLNNNVG